MTSWRWEPFFTEKEFTCKHTGRCEMDARFMDQLFMMRKAANFPFVIRSGYRDRSHPVEARKDTTGEHTLGLAVDIGVTGEQAYWLVTHARQYGFTRIGVKQHGPMESRFVHLGMATDGFAWPWVWSYP